MKHKKANKIETRGDHARVYLTRGYITIVDVDDLPLIRGYNWSAHIGKNTIYAKAYVDGTNILLHRLLLSPPKDMDVDHINHDGLDNRKHNLRICTRSSNNANRSKVTGSSKYTGVYRHAGAWDAYIFLANRRIHVGRFSCEIAAAHARDIKVLEKYDNGARLNFPTTDYGDVLVRENIERCRLTKTNKTKFRGVSVTKSGKYRAVLARKHLGVFDTAEEAYKRYLQEKERS
jgi:hypothetical protein